ncbi:helix-turn-helix domain-containing protein [Citricoccus parietis]|uniref:Helix-turn-helix domain-containing protein n=1 Tax=Citricoccus parietis TaxID=592307 RepID=A0ABV6F4H4_9MICC
MPWTPLHAALGEKSTELTFEMFQRAVAQRIEETVQLDWKGQMPLTSGALAEKRRESERYELAKDIAAMANTGGGMIAYGVSETKVDGRTAAGGLVGVSAVSEDDKKRIHQLAFSMVHPPVSGLELREILPEGRADGGVLVLLVPDSQDAPHLVVQKGDGGFFHAPWRSGAETFFMTERQLAEAYRLRQQMRHQGETQTGDLFSRFLEAVGATQDSGDPIWVVGVARPLRPLDDAQRVPPSGVERVVWAAREYPWIKDEMKPLIEATEGPVRRGYRMHHLTRERTVSHLLEGASSRRIGARVEVHGDGTLAVGITRDGVLGREVADPGHVPWRDLELVGLDLLAMILSLQQAGGPKTDYEMQIGLSRHTEVFRTKEPGDDARYAPFREEERVRGFRPIRGLVVTQHGRRELIESACVVIDDAVSQTGATMTHTPSWLDSQLHLDEW